MTHKKFVLITFFLLALVAAACDTNVPPTPTLAPAPTNTPAPTVPPVNNTPEPTGEPETTAPDGGVLISEMLPGVPGGNLQEFIELYNAGSDVVDLNGWSLWYALRADKEETLVYVWDTPALIPPLGHYLLVHEGQAFGLLPDAAFETALAAKGGLILRDAAGETVDQFGWGDAPEGSFAGSPAPAPTDGASLERLPGGADGNGVNSGDNAADLFANPSPNPQNSGSPIATASGTPLAIDLQAPGTVEPGAEFEYAVQVQNVTDTAVSGVRVSVPIPDYFILLAAPDGAVQGDGRVEWTLGDLDGGASATAVIRLQAPYTYVDTLVNGYYTEADGVIPVFGPLYTITMAGGSIPVSAARELMGNVVSVEGIATMYTGGFYAGSTGTKFYIEDETGGIQVFVPGGASVVEVNVGDRVRVTGTIEVYRDAIEIVPGDIVAEVEVTEKQAADPEPSPIPIPANETDDTVLGRLNTVEGIATRIEEFSFSYEVDLTDDQGNTTLVYIEKDTGVTAEPLDVGLQYRITGISEFYSNRRQIKPRLQSDIVQVFPPVLQVEMSAPNSILPGAPLTYTITAYNHTDAPMSNVRITAVPPAAGAVLDAIQDGGVESDGRIIWTIDELAGDGGAATVHYTVIAPAAAADPLLAPAVTATADQWPDPAVSDDFLTFIGSSVPIWAIQGDGLTSPYVRSEATTEGVVTGVFPELSGFWIQELNSDDDPATSAGLFILTQDFDIPVQAGDLVRVSGRVREISGQTTLHALTPEAITVLSSANALPEPVVVDPPQETEAAVAYKETLEGMLVTLGEPALVVAPTTRFGEYVLLYERWGVDTVRRGEETGFFIFVDDGSSVAHTSQATLSYAVQRGDVVTGLSGPFAYTFGHYKIEPITTPEIAHSEQPLPTLTAVGPNQFSVATFNVENLFDRRDPHPSSPPRPTREEYELKLNKLAEAVVAMGAPTIVGLQEVENIGILEELVTLEQLAPFSYEPYLIEGADSRGIDVGYLVRSDQASVEGVASYAAPEGLTSRPPLVITATIHLDSTDLTVVALNNHFTSLAGGEEATEPRRTAQAAWNVTLIDRIRVANPDALIIVMGDLNSFPDTLPILTLEEAGLVHVYDFFETETEQPYTYIFQGATQTLDHILVSEGLAQQLTAVTALHIDADYPIMSLEDSSARRVSDHDPLIAIFTLD
ncbi:MAG: lamin tail domain-containing protein [Anaerolineae bacterium]